MDVKFTKKLVLELWYTVIPIKTAPNFSLCPLLFDKRMLQIAAFQLYLEFSKDKLDSVSSFSAQKWF